MKKYYLQTKEGNKIDVDLMDLNHLKNVLKMILKNIDENTKPKKKKTGNIESRFEEAKFDYLFSEFDSHNNIY